MIVHKKKFKFRYTSGSNCPSALQIPGASDDCASDDCASDDCVSFSANVRVTTDECVSQDTNVRFKYFNMVEATEANVSALKIFEVAL